MRKIILYSLLGAAAAFLATVAYAVDVTNDHARIESGETAKLNKMPWDSTYCRNVKNNNSLAIFVPYKTRPEWDAFVNYAPNKEISSCATTPPPPPPDASGCLYCYWFCSAELKSDFCPWWPNESAYGLPPTAATSYWGGGYVDWTTWANNRNNWFTLMWNRAWNEGLCTSRCGSVTRDCQVCLAQQARIKLSNDRILVYTYCH